MSSARPTNTHNCQSTVNTRFGRPLPATCVGVGPPLLERHETSCRTPLAESRLARRLAESVVPERTAFLCAARCSRVGLWKVMQEKLLSWLLHPRQARTTWNARHEGVALDSVALTRCLPVSLSALRSTPRPSPGSVRSRSSRGRQRRPSPAQPQTRCCAAAATRPGRTDSARSSGRCNACGLGVLGFLPNWISQQVILARRPCSSRPDVRGDSLDKLSHASSCMHPLHMSDCREPSSPITDRFRDAQFGPHPSLSKDGVLEPAQVLRLAQCLFLVEAPSRCCGRFQGAAGARNCRRSPELGNQVSNT